MKQMQARLQIELMHTFCAISIVRVNYDFIDVLGKFISKIPEQLYYNIFF